MTIFSLVIPLVLGLFLLLKFRSRDVIPPVILLFLSAAILAVESFILNNPEQFFLKHYVLNLEGFLPLVAMVYSTFFCRQTGIDKLSWASRILLPMTLLFAAGTFWFKPGHFFFSPDFGTEKIIFLTNAGFLFYLLLMVLLILSMVQLERTLSALSQHERWRVKFEIIAFCVLLGAHVVYFSQSLLYRSLDMGMLDVRSFALLLTSALLFYSRFFRSRGERITVSRSAAYRSLILFAVGAYLIGLGLLGEGMRYLNFPAPRTFLFALAMVSAVILSTLFLSESIRRKLKVYLHKNFQHNKYDYRQHWLAFTEQISSSGSLMDLRQAILVFFCETFALKGAVLYQYHAEDNQFQPTSQFEFYRDWRPFSCEDALIKLLADQERIVDLNEINPSLSDSLVTSLTDAGASLVVPMPFDNQLAGFIVFTEQINRSEEFIYEDFDLMRILARQSIATLQGIGLAEQLSTARELAAIGKVSTFVLHDLKNQVSGLALMLDNAKDYIEDPDFQQDMLETVSNTVTNMKGLIARLKNLKEKPRLILTPVDLKKIVDDAVAIVGKEIVVTGSPVKIDADAEEIYKVVLNLLLNAREASSDGSTVKIVFGLEQGQALIKVTDSGCGMSAEFIQQRLFKPFETTKKHGFGIGLYQCKQIVESHHGRISVDSREGEGTEFKILLPLAE